ncbi:MAG TPA: Sec-independent protein translocase protein TatB [Pseudolabrys sp.]|nr:Sec-independent protein translocase protein TatB [Pseudolabrys sp.]
MFDIGWGELVVIGIVALIAIGPKELPTVLRTLGQYMGKVRRMASEFQGQFQEAMREAEMADLKKQAEDLKSSVSDLTNFDPMASTKKEIESAFVMPEVATASEPSTDAAPAVPAALPEPQQQEAQDVNVPLPEPPSPVSEKDFAPAEVPPPKQAGGGG